MCNDFYPTVYEIKIDLGRRWEDTPVASEIKAWDSPDFTIKLFAQALSNATGSKVRYNEKGSLQGHYVEAPDLGWNHK